MKQALKTKKNSCSNKANFIKPRKAELILPSIWHRWHWHPLAHPRIQPLNAWLVIGWIKATQRINAIVCRHRYLSLVISTYFIIRIIGCPIIIWTGLNIKIGIVQKVYKWSSCPFAKMIPRLENHFGKIPAFWTMPILIASPVQIIMRQTSKIQKK